MHWGLRETVLFVLSGLSVAALAVVSVAGPLRTSQIILIAFGSLTAAIAAPMIESRRTMDPGRPPAQPPANSRPDAAQQTVAVDYAVLRSRPGEPRSVVGRDAELAQLHAQLAKQQKSERL